MVYRLPAGKHYGEVLQKWESPAFTLSAIRYGAGTKTPPHTNELATLVFVLHGGYLKNVNARAMACETHSALFIPEKWLQADEFWAVDTNCVVVDCKPSLLGRIE